MSSKEQVVSRKERLAAISDILRTESINTQVDLMNKMQERGYNVAQGTLSRDIKYLKITKEYSTDGAQVYKLPEMVKSGTRTDDSPTIEFSGELGIVRTKPGHAMAVASEIDAAGLKEILATVAGDDTILVIQREGYKREQVREAILKYIF
ncbi:MAG: ArgR family transcriptional regulator [Tannerellaceae bacterium]|jgi:transcriptional regulator of arginine metabolism|nr:ArgR family transcriptional regulator [Tannerellaceae bacterium]